MQQQTIAITATFTADPLEEVLAFWMRELSLPLSIALAPYNQVFQQLLDPGSLLARNANGVNVVLVRFEDWQRFESPFQSSQGHAGPAETVQRNSDDFIAALIAAAEHSASPYLVCLCPPSPGLDIDPERAAFYRQVEESVASRLLNLSSVLVITPAELARVYPVVESYDPHGDVLGHIPYTPAFFAALGTLLARKIYRLRSAPRKVIVVDCDETLWKGVCGEVGALGVEFDPPRRALQNFLVAQHDAGMLVCLCSKNVAEDVWDVFQRRSEMPLKREHLVSWCLNWQLKSANLRALAEELQLGLDSFIFIDDNPVECAEVEAHCPAVLTLPLPQTPEDIPRFLKHAWAFDHLQLTAEDQMRTALYRQNVERERFRREAFSLSDFLEGLGLDIRFSEPEPEQLARVAQLTQRTNQFNCSVVRRSESEVQQLCRPGGLSCLAIEVTDRFGDYGLVGILLFKEGAEAIEVDTFLLSCRVLGRGVEHRMLNRLGEIARECGLGRVDVPFVPTKKNQPALSFLGAVGGRFKEPRDTGWVFRFPAEIAATVSHGDESAPVTEAVGGEAPVARPGAEAPAPSQLLCRIASELSRPEQVLAAIVTQKRMAKAGSPPSALSEAQFVAPRTPVEEALAGIWSDVLGVDPVGTDDNFFHLGGDSLLATQVVARLRHALHIQLPLRSFFEAPTVASLAVLIVQSLAESAHGAEMVDFLDELEAPYPPETLPETHDQ